VIDSHTHLFLCDGAEDEVVARAREAGVTRMLNVGLGGDSNETAIEGAERHEGVYAAVGCHPTSAGEWNSALGKEINRLAGNPKVRAIGETGIDYYRETASPMEQWRAFDAQIAIARRHRLPIVVHARDKDGETAATDRAFEILDSVAGENPVILHCFLAPWRVDDAIERGWFCSFSGIVTFPKSDALRQAAAKLPDDLLLVETDAPYLAPQPVRGRPNEPAHVVSTAEVIAEVRGVSYEELERTVEGNARALFGW
jgi:TatD DNase family protein